MEESLINPKTKFSESLVFFLVWVMGAIVLYFLISAAFTPSWVIGEQVSPASQYVDIKPQDLKKYSNLQKFFKNVLRNTEEPKTSVSVLIRGTNGEGRNLKKFLDSQMEAAKNKPYPYVLLYDGHFYGIDIIFQFKSPLTL